jgi:hypothetical protein
LSFRISPGFLRKHAEFSPKFSTSIVATARGRSRRRGVPEYTRGFDAFRGAPGLLLAIELRILWTEPRGDTAAGIPPSSA